MIPITIRRGILIHVYILISVGEQGAEELHSPSIRKAELILYTNSAVVYFFVYLQSLSLGWLCDYPQKYINCKITY